MTTALLAGSEGGGCTIMLLLVGSERDGCTTTALLAGSEGDGCMIVLLAGSEGDSDTNVELNQREDNASAASWERGGRLYDCTAGGTAV